MKIIINKILFWSKYTIIALMLALGIVLAGLHFAGSLLENYRADFEQFVSNVIHQPVQIGEIAIGSRGLEPVVRLRRVIIFNHEKSKKLLQVRELQIGIDLVGSLFKLQIKPGMLLVRGSEFNIYQTKTGKIAVVGMPAASDVSSSDASSMLDEVSPRLFEQVRIDLEDVVLKWHRLDGRVIRVTDLYLNLSNGVLQHHLKAGGKLEQKKSPATFAVDLKLHGNFSLAPAISYVSGEVVIENWFPELSNNQFSGNSFAMPLAGDINLSIKSSKVITNFFRQPMVVKNLGSRITWSHHSDGLKVNINDLNFADNWLSASGGGELWLQTGAEMPIADIKLNFKLVNLAKAKLYYPVTLLPENATVWLDHAFVGGNLIAGKMILRGPLDKFPFDNNEGKFSVDTNLRNVNLNYDADWPRIENINGKMIFANRSLTILASSAKIVNEPVQSVKVTINDLELPILEVDGVINADASSGLRFLDLSPLKNSVGRKLQSISLTGPMKFSLKMRMPLSDDVPEKATKVDGNIELYNNKMHVDVGSLVINGFTGKLFFSDGDLAATGLSGKLFDKPTTIDIKTSNPDTSDAITQIKLGGSVAVRDLEHAFAVNLNPYVFGDFAYQALLELHASSVQNSFKLDSDLCGVEVDLPEPFAKKITVAHKFNLTCYFGGNKLPQMVINYNDQINAALMIKNIGSGAKSSQLAAGEVKLGGGSAKISTTAGLLLTGRVPRLDWTLWQQYLKKAKTSLAVASSVIRQVSLNTGELHVLGRIFKNASVKAVPKDNGWEIALLTTDIDGSIYFPIDAKAYIQGNFKKLYFGEEQQNLAKLQPQDLLSLNFKVDNLRYGNKNFSGVELVAERLANGLKINKLTASGANFQVEGEGDWTFFPAGQFSVFRGKISSQDVGGLLKQWDLTDNLVGGNGSANFILKWTDALYKPSLQKISGAVALHIGNGRIINFSKNTENKLSFGRVLNMLSLQTLPQRLSLDFSDLHQGFSFDTMDGRFELSESNVAVKNLILDGQVAYIKAHGRIGLVAKDYDMLLSAVPHHMTSSILPVTGAVTGGPVGAVLGLVVDKIISAGIKKTVSNTYRITGSWDNPKIEKA